jgi:hypothetical protein
VVVAARCFVAAGRGPGSDRIGAAAVDWDGAGDALWLSAGVADGDRLVLSPNDGDGSADGDVDGAGDESDGRGFGPGGQATTLTVNGVVVGAAGKQLGRSSMLQEPGGSVAVRAVFGAIVYGVCQPST